MGQKSLVDFLPNDSFLRRVTNKPGLFRQGIVPTEAFKPRGEEDALSFTFQHETLKSQTALEKYQLDCATPLGDLPGLCKLTFADLTIRVEPPLPPRYDPPKEPQKYGELHCVTDLPNKKQRHQMAALAAENGIVLPYIKKAKRKDL